MPHSDPPNLPIEKWLSPKELAAHWGLNEDSAYRWIAEGSISQKLIRHCGKLRILVHPSAIPILDKVFSDARRARRAKKAKRALLALGAILIAGGWSYHVQPWSQACNALQRTATAGIFGGVAGGLPIS